MPDNFIDAFFPAAACALIALLASGWRIRRVERALAHKFALLAEGLAVAQRESADRHRALSEAASGEIETLNERLQQTRAELRRLDVVAQRSTERARASVVDEAIQLARHGETPEQILRKTGLPADLVESIAALHAVRRH